MAYVPRLLERPLLRALRNFAAVILTGPRRGGKTTLLQHLLPKASYHLLEDPNLVARIRTDARAFIEEIRCPGILDEIQKATEIAKQQTGAGKRREIYFFRDQQGLGQSVQERDTGHGDSARAPRLGCPALSNPLHRRTSPYHRSLDESARTRRRGPEHPRALGAAPGLSTALANARHEGAASSSFMRRGRPGLSRDT